MSAALVALVGNPNSGKSSLFNALTGLRQKVANYPGATVDRRTGTLAGDKSLSLIDLPGSYSLTPHSPDEALTRDVLTGTFKAQKRPDALICVIDATNLAQHLKFVLELKNLDLPIVVALNMTDLAAREQIEIDTDKLSDGLGLPVVETVAVRRKGLDTLTGRVAEALRRRDTAGGDNADGNNAGGNNTADTASGTLSSMGAGGAGERDIAAALKNRQRDARIIAAAATLNTGIGHKATRIIDDILLHRVAGPAILFGLLFLIFQAVYSWGEAPTGWLEGGIARLQLWLAAILPDGALLSLLNDGVLAGVGSVVVFLPQIIILFAFILLLESSGYMARAAFLMDRLMSAVGLNGRAFLPLLSSFACAIPGIMAARAIADPKDRLTTILIAPLMTCSARLPVYTLVIAAFIPNTPVAGGWLGLQGVVMFALYITGILSALAVAYVLRRTVAKGAPHPFLLEMPKYQMPDPRYILTGLYEKTRIFLRRAGTIILLSMIVLWLLASFPTPPAGAEGPAIGYSLAGMIGQGLSVIFAPIGFNWEISVALVPGMAAREVAVAALGTVYSLQGGEDAVAAGLVSLLQGAWSLPTAFSFLAWYVFAPQCLSTLAVTRRETNSWRWPLFMAGYLFALAYLAAFLTYRISSALMA